MQFIRPDVLMLALIMMLSYLCMLSTIEFYIYVWLSVYSVMFDILSIGDGYDFAVLLGKIRKAVKYIDSSMLEDKETRGGNGSIYLKVFQL